MSYIFLLVFWIVFSRFRCLEVAVGRRPANGLRPAADGRQAAVRCGDPREVRRARSQTTRRSREPASRPLARHNRPPAITATSLSLRGRQPMEPLRPGQEMVHLQTALQGGLSIAETPHGQNTRRSGCEGSAGCRQATAGWNNCCLGRGGALREGGCPPIRKRLGGPYVTIRPETRHKRAA